MPGIRVALPGWHVRTGAYVGGYHQAAGGGRGRNRTHHGQCYLPANGFEDRWGHQSPSLPPLGWRQGLPRRAARPSAPRWLLRSQPQRLAVWKGRGRRCGPQATLSWRKTGPASTAATGRLGGEPLGDGGQRSLALQM